MELNSIIKLGQHRLFYGDATKRENYAKLFIDDKCNLLLVDPPYNVDYSGSTKRHKRLLNDNLKDRYKDFVFSLLSNSFVYMEAGTVYYIFTAGKEIGTYQNILMKIDAYQSTNIIWVKNHFVLSFADYKVRHENILYGWKKGAAHKYYGAKNQSTVIEVPKPMRNKHHSTQKPKPLIKQLILNSIKENEIVFDPCVGSGTTLLVAQETKRVCYAMELDPLHIKTIINRFKYYYPEEKIEIINPGGKINDEFEII